MPRIMEQAFNGGEVQYESKMKPIVEKWKNTKLNRVAEACEKMGIPYTDERNFALARLYENTESFIKGELNEATQTTDIGRYKRYAIDLITAVVPNLTAFDNVTVEALENKTGIVNYLKFTAGAAKGRTPLGADLASPLGLGPVDPNYTSKVVRGESVIVVEDGLAQLQYPPVMPGSLTLVIGDDVIIEDNGSLYKEGGDGSVVGTIEYSSGEIFYSAIKAHKPKTDTTDEVLATVIKADYKYNNEVIGHKNKRMPQINFKLVSLTLEAEDRYLAAYYPLTGAYQLKKEYGVQIDTLLNTQATAEIQREIDADIYFDIMQKCAAGQPLVWSKTPPMGSHITKMDHYQDFSIVLAEGAEQIHQATRRYRGNRIVCGTGAGLIISRLQGYKSTSSSDGKIGAYVAGEIDGMKVTVNPEFPMYEGFIGTKNDNYLDANYIYAPYMPILTTDLVTLADTSVQKGWVTSDAKIMLNPRAFIKFKIV